MRLIHRYFLDELVIGDVDVKKLEIFLYKCYEEKGFRSYYTLRKKTIKDFISHGLSRKDYWKSIGRLDELKAFSENIKTEYAKQVAGQKKATKKVKGQEDNT
ncbi:MAG: hypothetical protein EHM34_06520 [Nitrosopumilales archaeon]|nr:MAG: hypothetical protein EHM34_06520 [Nitrosopumilales archaeon]